jgi:antitoxin component YwqK of YwqJK toxin-antitoxin module
MFETKFYENGIMYMFSYEDQIKNKHSYYFYEDGVLSMHMQYLNNKRHGECQSYYLNGHLSAIVTFKNDLKHGDLKQFSPYGELLEHFYYFEDVLKVTFTTQNKNTI